VNDAGTQPSRWIFETLRLRFRRFEPDDLNELARISADPEISRFVGDGEPLSRADTRQWIENSRGNVERFGYGTGAVVLRDDGRLIGWAGFARPPGEPEELIYGLDRPWWGQRYGTELVDGLCAWALGTLGLTEVRATVNPANTASIALLTRRGFRLADDCYHGEPETHLYVLSRGEA